MDAVYENKKERVYVILLHHYFLAINPALTAAIVLVELFGTFPLILRTFG
jgi:hypothetical protein